MKGETPIERNEAWRYAALHYDFDAGSKDNYIQARFKNAIVCVRKAGRCAVCFGSVPVGALTPREQGILNDARSWWLEKCAGEMPAVYSGTMHALFDIIDRLTAVEEKPR